MPTEQAPGPYLGTNDRRMRRSRLIREGMSWRRACLESGYSLSVANKGPRGYAHGGRNEMRTRRPGILKDFERAAAEAVWNPEALRQIVIHRLATSVVDGTPSGVAREAELIGRLKETDMFVNAHTGTDVGVWGIIADLANDETFKRDSELLREYDQNRCVWCEEKQESLEALQLHTLTCTYRPAEGSAKTNGMPG